MKKNALLAFILVLLSTAVTVGFVRPVEADWTWTETIYIKADGSVEPDTAPISTVDNITYILTDNIVEACIDYARAIVVERDDIVVDGAGYTLQGTEAYSSIGIDLSHRNNVTLKNVEVANFTVGIVLLSSSNNTLVDNTASNNTDTGIRLDSSSNNVLSGNTASSNNQYGIYLTSSSNNVLSGNTASSNNYFGILLWSSSHNNTVTGNTASSNNHAGIYLAHSSNNNITGNTASSNNEDGIYLGSSSNNNIIGNTASNNDDGIHLSDATNNTVTGNTVSSNGYEGIYVLHSTNNTVTGNTASSNNGSGIFLWPSSNNIVTGNTASNNTYGIRLSDSTNNTVTGNAVSSNNEYGICLWSSSHNNTVTGNAVSSNTYVGIYLYSSSNNVLSGNTASNNQYGIYLEVSSNNVLFHNNFINNTYQVHFYTSGYANVWDNGYPSGGNYWSDYNRTDTDNDGIGNTPYIIDVNNQDNYPLMGMFSEFNATSEYHVQTICNSSISDFQYNGTAICFNVTGENDTTGFCRIFIPRALMNETYQVFVNGTEVPCNLLPCSNTTHSYLYFTYNHSTQEVMIVPEFPTWTSMLLILIVLSVAIAIYKRRLLKTPIH